MDRKPQWEICPVNGHAHRIPVPGGWLYKIEGSITFVPTPADEAKCEVRGATLDWRTDNLAHLVAFHAQAFKKLFGEKYPWQPIHCQDIQDLFDAVTEWSTARDEFIKEMQK